MGVHTFFASSFDLHILNLLDAFDTAFYDASMKMYAMILRSYLREEYQSATQERMYTFVEPLADLQAELQQAGLKRNWLVLDTIMQRAIELVAIMQIGSNPS